MSRSQRVIEMMGTVDSNHRLVLDEALEVEATSRVRVLILVPEEDINEAEWMNAASRNRVFDFLKDSAEDTYTLSDGNPVDNEG